MGGSQVADINEMGYKRGGDLGVSGHQVVGLAKLVCSYAVPILCHVSHAGFEKRTGLLRTGVICLRPCCG